MIPPAIPRPLDNTERTDKEGRIFPAAVVRCYRCGVDVIPGTGVQVPIGKLLPIVHAVCPFLAMLLLAGCFGPEVRLPGYPEPNGAGVSRVIQYIALAAAAIGSFGLFVAILIAIIVKDFALAFKAATAAVATIIGSAILHWLGSHLFLAVGGCVCVGLIAGILWTWIHRRWVVDQVEQVTGSDLDKDGDIGGNREHG